MKKRSLIPVMLVTFAVSTSVCLGESRSKARDSRLACATVLSTDPNVKIKSNQMIIQSEKGAGSLFEDLANLLDSHPELITYNINPTGFVDGSQESVDVSAAYSVALNPANGDLYMLNVGAGKSPEFRCHQGKIVDSKGYFVQFDRENFKGDYSVYSMDCRIPGYPSIENKVTLTLYHPSLQIISYANTLEVHAPASFVGQGPDPDLFKGSPEEFDKAAGRAVRTEVTLSSCRPE